MSNKGNEITDTANNILVGMDKEVEKKDPFYELKMDMLHFFRDYIHKITSKNALIEEIERNLLDRVESFTSDELFRLYGMLMKNDSGMADSLISIFKPVPGSPSIFAETMSKQEDEVDAFENIFEKATPEDLQKIEKLRTTIEKIYNNSGKKTED